MLRGEVLIAVGFGLVHGLAFASAIGELDLDRGSLVTTLLGFNVGIEATQVLVVALVVPSLLVLARTRAYPAVRTALAVVGLVFSASWVLERTGLSPADPFVGAQGWLVAHPLVVVAVLAALALAAWITLPVRRRPSDPIGAARGRMLSHPWGIGVGEQVLDGRTAQALAGCTHHGDPRAVTR